MTRFSFSQRSQNNLSTVHPDLALICRHVLDTGIMDFSIVEGARSLTRQKALVEKGVSKTLNSKHLIQNDGFAHAVDLYPYPVDMGRVRSGNAVEICRFGLLAGMFLLTAQHLRETGQITSHIRWGGDWDTDGQTLDHRFFDAPHFEIV